MTDQEEQSLKETKRAEKHSAEEIKQLAREQATREDTLAREQAIEKTSKARKTRESEKSATEEIKQLAREQGKKLYQEYLGNQNWDKILVFVTERLPAKEDGMPDMEHEQSDVVHDLLAFLAEEMTRLNKEKQSKIKHFLTWLEKDIFKGSVEDQKNKTKIRNFHEGSIEELMDVLKKNKVIPDPCPSSTWDTISVEFSTAMNTLGPLKSQITMTDKLIDQIVYKLYELTDEEIAIVERGVLRNDY